MSIQHPTFSRSFFINYFPLILALVAFYLQFILPLSFVIRNPSSGLILNAVVFMLCVRYLIIRTHSLFERSRAYLFRNGDHVYMADFQTHGVFEKLVFDLEDWMQPDLKKAVSERLKHDEGPMAIVKDGDGSFSIVSLNLLILTR